MRVFSPVTQYTVITRIGGGRRLIALDGAGKHCLLVIINNAAEAKRLLHVLLEWRKNEAFTDLIEFFPYKCGIIAVFACYVDGQPLNFVPDDADYPLRAAVLRSLFALVLRQNLPHELLCEVLSPENLLLSPSGRVRLLYDLPCGGTATLCEAAKRICGECSIPELNSFYKKLDDGAYRDYAEMYEAAGCVADVLMEYNPPPKTDKLTVSGVKERTEAVKTALLEYCVVIIAMGAMIAGYLAVGIMFYYTVIAPPRVDYYIQRIGSVVTGDGS